MLKETKVEVLIIGAGPAGVMAANALARAGVNVKIVDKRPEKVMAGHADGIQPRTIEVFQSYGLAERLLREGNHMHMAVFYNPSSDGGILRDGRVPDVTAPTARFPHEITLHQGAIEAIFHDSMRKHKLEVDRPFEPIAIELDDREEVLASAESYPVKVTLKHLGVKEGQEDTETVYAKYVLGTDGGHSWVRRVLGFTMDGEQTDSVWGVVDIVPTTNFPDIRNRCVIHSHTGSCMIIPREGDVVRLYLQLSDEDAKEVINVNGRVDLTKWSPQKLMQVAKRNLKPYTIDFPEEVQWWTLYIIGQKVASHYSKRERIFIAGDACHTHSPKAGQGMNASMNDSHNLAWKLTHVLRGWADPLLLSTYEFERRKYAQDLINFDKKFSALFSGKPRTEENQDGISHAQFLEAFQTFGGFTSGIGIQYSPSPLTCVPNNSAATNLTSGARMPPQTIIRAADARPFELQDLLPSDSRFKVIIFAGDLDLEVQRTKVEQFAKEFMAEEMFMERYGRKGEKGKEGIFDVLTVLVGKKETVNYTSVPAVLRSHWSKVFVDDIEIKGVNGGEAYTSYGIASEGAVVVVRPDGYIGTTTRLDGMRELDDYFAGFMKPSVAPAKATTCNGF